MKKRKDEEEFFSLVNSPWIIKLNLYCSAVHLQHKAKPGETLVHPEFEPVLTGHPL